MKSYFDIEKTPQTFDQLPIGAKKALAGRIIIECGHLMGNFEVENSLSNHIPDHVNETNYGQELTEAQWNAILEITQRHFEKCNQLFYYFEMRTQDVQNIILEHHEELAEDYENWDDYKDDYGSVKNHSADNRFACIAFEGDPVIFDDGWHRLHSYINQGHSTIPIVEF